MQDSKTNQAGQSKNNSKNLTDTINEFIAKISKKDMISYGLIAAGIILVIISLIIW
jgi:hypothetical protein